MTKRYLATIVIISIGALSIFSCQSIGVESPVVTEANGPTETTKYASGEQPEDATALAEPTDETTVSLPLIVRDGEATPEAPTTVLPPQPTTVLPPQPTVPPAPPTDPAAVLEDFEGDPSAWQVEREATDGGSIEATNAQATEGSNAVRLAVANQRGRAQLFTAFRDAAVEHQWEERSGTWHWQQTSMYIPSSTIAQLQGEGYITLASLYPSNGGPFGWSLRVREKGQLYVYGYTADGAPVEFSAYGVLPQDRWIEVQLGLHSQNGPGVKRAFAFLIDGQFYGWYRQGHMKEETYDRAAFGILETTHNGPLELFIDQWRIATNQSTPSGPDLRSVAALQERDFRDTNGAQIQIDWSTWANQLTLDPRFGLYSANSRIQAGLNLDRMPELRSGWAEIEIDWTQDTPSTDVTGAFAGLLAFHKDVNREENLEVAPVFDERGSVTLIYNAWTGGDPVIFADWQLPEATGAPGNLPEPGDILRVRWEQLSDTTLNVRVSYYDASTETWHTNIIDDTRDLTSIPDANPADATINYLDEFHIASSLTIDSPFYSIRRYKVGTLETYPE